MESGFYGALGDVVVIAPGPEWIDDVHTNYLSMAKSGVCSQQQRQVFYNAGQRMVADENIEAVLLAGTDLVLAFRGENPSFRVFDCAQGARAENRRTCPTHPPMTPGPSGARR